MSKHPFNPQLRCVITNRHASDTLTVPSWLNPMYSEQVRIDLACGMWQIRYQYRKPGTLTPMFRHLRVGGCEFAAGMMWYDEYNRLNPDVGVRFLNTWMEIPDFAQGTSILDPYGPKYPSYNAVAVNKVYGDDPPVWYGPFSGFTDAIDEYQDSAPYRERTVSGNINFYIGTRLRGASEVLKKRLQDGERWGALLPHLPDIYDGVLSSVYGGSLESIPANFGIAYRSDPFEYCPLFVTKDTYDSLLQPGLGRKTRRSLAQVSRDCFDRHPIDDNFGHSVDPSIYTRFLDKEFDLLVFLGELPETFLITLEMLKSLVPLFVGSIPSRLLALMKLPASLRLMTKFGLDPYLNDVGKLAQIWLDLLEHEPKTLDSPTASSLRYEVDPPSYQIARSAFSRNEVINNRQAMKVRYVYPQSVNGMWPSPLGDPLTTYDGINKASTPYIGWKAGETVLMHYIRPMAYRRTKLWVDQKALRKRYDERKMLPNRDAIISTLRSYIALIGMEDDSVENVTRREELLRSLWELIPFTWLLDYFTNASDFLTDPNLEDREWMRNNTQGHHTAFAGVEYGVVEIVPSNFWGNELASEQLGAIGIHSKGICYPLHTYGVKEFVRNKEVIVPQDKAAPIPMLTQPTAEQVLNTLALIVLFI